MENPHNYIKSYGLLCFCKIKGEIKALLVKKKYTYEFFNFVVNNYCINKSNVIKLFNKMTIDEKRLIMKLDYDVLWSKLWYETSSYNNIIYHKNKSSFDTYVQENKQVLLKQLNNSVTLKDSECDLWTVPKGKKSYPSEDKLLVAIREFNEETGIQKNNYYIDFDFKKSFVIDHKYKIKFYICIYKNNCKLSIDYSNEKLLYEINGISWFSLNDIIKECNYLYKYIKPAFTYIRNKNLLL